MHVATRLMLAAGSLLIGAPGWAGSSANFPQCDGYAAPTSYTDGMTTVVHGLTGRPAFFPAMAIARQDLSASREGVAACDAALADERLPPQYWLRKVDLVRARAIHRLAAGDRAGAVDDLKRAEAAAIDPNDPYYRRSLGLGIDLVRAFALRLDGHRDQAIPLAMATWQKRPYDRHIGLAVLSVLDPDDNGGDVETVLRHLAALQPKAIDRLFVRAFEARRFDDAIAIYRQLAAPLNVRSEGWSNRREDRLNDIGEAAFSAVYRADRHGCYAYALAATGKARAAGGEIAAARTAIVQELADGAQAEPTSPGKPDKYATLRATSFAEARRAATARIDDWAAAVERRSRGAGNEGPPTGDASLAFLETLRSTTHVTADPDFRDLVAMRSASESEMAGPNKALDTLFNNLPETETEQRIAKYRQAKNFIGQLAAGKSGFKIVEHPDHGFTTVQFIGEVSSASVVEELTLLAAADAALQSGRKGLVIVNRRDLQRMVATMAYYTPVRIDPFGFQSAIDVVFVDPDNLPDQYKTAAWRVIDAAAVRAQIGQFYERSTAAR
jgi:hypothetical protein